MKSRILAIAAAIAGIALTAETGVSCSLAVGNGPRPNTLEWTKLMVARTDVILRVTAVEYVIQPQGNTRTNGDPGSTVRFTVAEVVKGTYAARDLVLPGYLTEIDEWNPGNPPYTGPRRTALSGSCYSNTYRKGGQFLLMLVRNVGGYSATGLPLSPSNEQLRSAEDPWLLWVRDEVKAK